ncbi:MAG: tetratricopeptide repeat protein, partial [Acidobacteriota bacterium]|nr:tetratricopeptide repeat protein [Acidobacteriota bacterium]
GKAYELKGAFQDAIAEYQRAEQLNDDPRALTYLGHALAAAGRRDEALRILNQMKEMSKHRYVSPYYFAIVYAGLGDSDEAFRWLETCHKEHEGRLVFLRVEPYFDNLRSDPRLADLIERVGI